MTTRSRGKPPGCRPSGHGSSACQRCGRRSGSSDKVGTNSDSAMDAESRLAELKCQYAEMQKDAIEVAYMLHADPASVKRSKCIVMFYVEGYKQKDIAPEVGYSSPGKVSQAISDGLHQLAELVSELNLS